MITTLSKRFSYSFNLSWFFPIELYYGEIILSNDERVKLPFSNPSIGEWGMPLSYKGEITIDSLIPLRIHAIWISLYERKLYSKTIILSKDIQNVISDFVFISESNEISLIVGLSLYGQLSLWMLCDGKSKILLWDDHNHPLIQDNIIDIDKSDIDKSDIDKTCSDLLSSNLFLQKNLLRNGLPPCDLFDNYMKQFAYRYQVVYKHWDEDEEIWIKYDEDMNAVIPELEYIEESLYDGTHDKLHDGGLMKYHEAGKPKKLALKWHIKKSDYSAYFWFEDEEICAIFNKFYGQHPDSKTDFIIHIDPINKRYELSLYRYGLKEPLVIPEKAYQLIVFKSGFENYRSENYNQPTGAWIW